MGKDDGPKGGKDSMKYEWKRKIDSKNRLVLPKAALEALGIAKGGKVVVTKERDGIAVRREG